MRTSLLQRKETLKKVGIVEKGKKIETGKDRRRGGLSSLRISKKKILTGQPKGTTVLLTVEASSKIVLEEDLWLFPSLLVTRQIILQKPVRLVTLLS